MSGSSLWVRFAILGFTISAALPVKAAKPIDEATTMQEARIATCIRSAAEGRIWLERTLWGLRDQEAGWIGAEIANPNGSHDLGPLQINSWWVARIATLTGKPAAYIHWWLVNDACFNVNVAKWIFLSDLAATGDYWKAVGIYHSPTEWRQRRYVRNVSRHLKRRYGVRVFAR